MPNVSQMLKWSKSPLAEWFFDRLSDKYGNIDTEWRTVATVEDLNFLKGKADVIDYIKSLLTEPESFAQQQVTVLSDDSVQDVSTK